jgi:hypothetical protein
MYFDWLLCFQKTDIQGLKSMFSKQMFFTLSVNRLSGWRGDRVFVKQLICPFIGFLFILRIITPTLYQNRQQLLPP